LCSAARGEVGSDSERRGGAVERLGALPLPGGPPVASAICFTEEVRRQLRQAGRVEPPAAEWDRVRAKWLVSYSCSYDTDAAGLPETLHVLVDGETGAADRHLW
jgi:hypothetical protein